MRLATEATGIALGTTTSPTQLTILTPPYEGSCTMLRIGKTWITANCKNQYTMRTKPWH